MVAGTTYTHVVGGLCGLGLAARLMESLEPAYTVYTCWLSGVGDTNSGTVMLATTHTMN